MNSRKLLNIVNTIKKYCIYIVFFVLMLIFSISIITYEQNAYNTKTLYGNTDTTSPFPIQKDMVIEQEFSSESLKGVLVNFESVVDIDQVANVDVEIELIDSATNTKLASSFFNTLQTGIGAKSLDVPEELRTEERDFLIRIIQKTASEDGKVISLLTEQNPDPNDPNQMYIDGVLQHAKLSISVREDANTHFMWFVASFLSVIIMISVYMIKVKKPYEQLFLVLFIGIGLLISIMMSPFSIPDEATHYDRAYSLSNKMFGYDDIMRRKEDLKLFTYLHTPDKNTVQTTFDNMFKVSESNEMVEGNVIHSRGAKTLPYLFSSIGISAGKLLHLGAYPMFYLGRLCNLLVSACLIYFAIKLIPIGKCILFAITFFPMTMHLVGSYSYDSIVISSTMLFVAYILYIKYTKKMINRNDYFVLTSMPMLFLSAKSFGYLAFLLLLFLLPWKEEWKKNRSRVLIFAFGAGGIFLYTSGSISLVKDFISPVAPVAGDVTTTNEEIAMHTYGDVFRSPFKYIIMVATSLYRNIEAFIKGMVGNSLCWLTFPIKEFIVYLNLVLLIFTGLNPEKDFTFKKRDKLFIWFAGLATCAIVVLSMAIAFTPKDLIIIIGVQGRYFIPATVLLMLGIYSIPLKLNKNITSIILYSMILLQIFTIMDISLNIMRI